jgi:hypothetical protein
MNSLLEHISKSSSRFDFIGQKFGMSDEEVDDLKSEYSLALLEGRSKHQLLDLFQIDQYRKRTNKRSSPMRPDLRKSSYKLLDIQSELSELGIQYDAKCEFIKCCNFLLHYGKSHDEVCDIFSISSPALYQLMKGQKSREDLKRRHRYKDPKYIKLKEDFKNRILYFRGLIKRIEEKNKRLESRITFLAELSNSYSVEKDYNIENTIIRNIRELKSFGFNQSEISKKLGICSRTLRNYLKKEIK